MAVVSPFPTTIKYGYDNSVVMKDNTFSSKDGLYFALSDSLSAAKDISINQDTLTILTDNYNLNSKLIVPTEIDRTQIITRTTISFYDGLITRYLCAVNALGNIIFTPNLYEATIFTLNFSPSGLNISNDSGLFITRNGVGDLNLQYYNSTIAATGQAFNYTLFGEKVAIFVKTTNEVFVAGYSSLELEPCLSSNFGNNKTFFFNRFKYGPFFNYGETNLAKYVSTPNDLTIRTATSNLSYNYLITAPYSTLDNTVDYINSNITPLKNYYSPEGLQTPTLSTQLKQYNKLYTGLNTTNGNDKIYLSYKGSEISKTFAKDKDTYFHFPVSATNIALSASTLVKAGALGGSSPWRSDRLFVKKANYRKYSNWGNFNGNQNGTFFCTWLSASLVSGTEGVWMDRYFNPAHVNLTSALTSTAFLTASNNLPNLIWDVPSTQVFNNESLYIYHRIGPEDNQLVVDTLSSSLTQYYKNWANPLINEVTGLSAGALYNFTASAVQTLPGTIDESLDTSLTYGAVDLSDADFDYQGITLAFQAYNTDWGNVKGSQLVGNYYKGGIGIEKINTLLTPFISLINFTDGGIKTYNTSLTPLNTTPASLNGKNVIVKGSYDDSYYIITNNKKILVYDQDGLNVNSYTFTLSGDLLNAFLIVEQNKDQIIVATKPNANTVYWKKFNIDGTTSTTGTVSGSATNYSNFTIDLSGGPVYYNSISGNGTVDSNNVVFALSGDRLIRSINTSASAAILSAINAEWVACDHENSVWVLYGIKNLCKIDNCGNVLWDISLTNKAQTNSFPRTITFTSEINYSTGKIKHYGLILDPRTQQIFKVASDGTIVGTATVSDGNCLGYAIGDITGYDYQRKFIYNSESDNDIAVKVYVKDSIGNKNSASATNLNYDVSYLTPGWHHFAVTFDITNKIKFYIDGDLVKSTTVGSVSSIYKVYNFKNNPDLMIGTASFKTQTLTQFLAATTDDYRFNGKIADVRFYSQALQQSDIKSLQKRFLLSSFTDLVWSAPTGQRYYIEQIERFFLHRLPGAKSNMFNLKIKNSGITNTALRNIIEKNIITSLSKTTPVHTKLNNILWS